MVIVKLDMLMVVVFCELLAVAMLKYERRRDRRDRRDERTKYVESYIGKTQPSF